MPSPSTPSSPAQPPPGRPSAPASRRAHGRPWSLVLTAAFVGLQAASLLVLGGYVVVKGIVGSPASWSYVAGIAVMALVAGLALLFVGRGLLAARRWSRAPALLAQLFAFAVAYDPLRALPVVRVAVLAMAGVTIVLLFVPSTNAALND